MEARALHHCEHLDSNTRGGFTPGIDQSAADSLAGVQFTGHHLGLVEAVAVGHRGPARRVSGSNSEQADAVMLLRSWPFQNEMETPLGVGLTGTQHRAARGNVDGRSADFPACGGRHRNRGTGEGLSVPAQDSSRDGHLSIGIRTGADLRGRRLGNKVASGSRIVKRFVLLEGRPQRPGSTRQDEQGQEDDADLELGAGHDLENALGQGGGRAGRDTGAGNEDQCGPDGCIGQQGRERDHCFLGECRSAQHGGERYSPALQSLLEPLARLGQPAGDGPLFPAQFLGRFFLALVLEAAEDERRLVFLRQMIQLIIEDRLQFLPGHFA